MLEMRMSDCIEGGGCTVYVVKYSGWEFVVTTST